MNDLNETMNLGSPRALEVLGGSFQNVPVQNFPNLNISRVSTQQMRTESIPNLEGAGGGFDPNDPAFQKKWRTDGWQSIFGQQPVSRTFQFGGKTFKTFRFAQLNDLYTNKARAAVAKINPNGFENGEPFDVYGPMERCFGIGGRFARDAILDFVQHGANLGMEVRIRKNQIYFKKGGQYFRGITAMKREFPLLRRHPVLRFIKAYLSAARMAKMSGRYGQKAEGDKQFVLTGVPQTIDQAAKMAYQRLKNGIKAAERFRNDPDKFARAQRMADVLKEYYEALRQVREAQNQGYYRGNMGGYVSDLARARHRLLEKYNEINPKDKLQNAMDQVYGQRTYLMDNWATIQERMGAGPRFRFSKKGRRGGETYEGAGVGRSFNVFPTEQSEQ